jgi:hypothetical protein
MLENVKSLVESSAKQVVTELKGIQYQGNFDWFDTVADAEAALINDLKKFLGEYEKMSWQVEPSINEKDGKFQPYTRFIVA